MRVLSLVICLFLSTLAFGQNIKGGILAGINASQVDGDCHGGYSKLGLNGGVIAIVPMSDRWSLSLEMLYSQRGSRERFNVNNVSGITYRLRLTYIDVPILANFAVDEKLSFGSGLVLGVLARSREFVNGVENLPISPEFNKFDIDVVINGQYKFADHLYANARFSITFIPTPIRVVPSCSGTPRLVGQINKFLTFRVVYIFNDD